MMHNTVFADEYAWSGSRRPGVRPARAMLGLAAACLWVMSASVSADDERREVLDAEPRHEVSDAESRNEVEDAESRREGSGAESRNEVEDAESRREVSD